LPMPIEDMARARALVDEGKVRPEAGLRPNEHPAFGF